MGILIILLGLVVGSVGGYVLAGAHLNLKADITALTRRSALVQSLNNLTPSTIQPIAGTQTSSAAPVVVTQRTLVVGPAPINLCDANNNQTVNNIALNSALNQNRSITDWRAASFGLNITPDLTYLVRDAASGAITHAFNCARATLVRRNPNADVVSRVEFTLSTRVGSQFGPITVNSYTGKSYQLVSSASGKWVIELTDRDTAPQELIMKLKANSTSGRDQYLNLRVVLPK